MGTGCCRAKPVAGTSGGRLSRRDNYRHSRAMGTDVEPGSQAGGISWRSRRTISRMSSLAWKKASMTWGSHCRPAPARRMDSIFSMGIPLR